MKIKEKVLSTLKGSPKNALLSRMIQLLFMKLNEGVFGFCREKDFTEKKGIFKIRLQKTYMK